MTLVSAVTLLYPLEVSFLMLHIMEGETMDLDKLCG